MRWIDELEWHKWFAWMPIKLNGELVFLRLIMRKRHTNSFFFEYKETNQ